MRRRLPVWTTMLLAIAIPRTGTRAQVEITGAVVTESGLHRANFRVAQGEIHVNYPDDLSVGDTITGSVYTEPAGKDQKEIERNSSEISGYVIEMPGQQAKTSDRRFRWSVPIQIGGAVIPLVLRDRKNKIITRCDLPVNPTPAAREQGGIYLPTGGQSGAFASVWGPFASPAGSTAVAIGGQNADVLAESPRKMVFQTPPNLAGASTIDVRTGSLSASGPFSLLGIRPSVTARVLTPGQTAVLTLTVLGLADLKEPASLVIVNHEPATVSLAGGPVQHVTIEPRMVGAGGTFTLNRTLTGEKGGVFDITAAISRSPSSQIPAERLTTRAVDNWSQAQGVPVTFAARAAIASDVVASRPQLDSLLMPQLGQRADPGTQLDWLVRAYCFDLRDRKLAGARVGKLFDQRRGIVRSWAPQQPPRSGQAVSIDAPDVQRFSFSQFLAQLLVRLTPSDPLGNLVVTSRPDRAAIVVDQASGSDYFTARSFVLSVGQHTVRVASCNQSVLVKANQQTRMSCPP
ncbi:MAG TPA: hypothetical protein VKB79_19940 [Bryobacteraceae bacterium]|nr:hypothetical protein [Bryobacteraceae bacterium]